MDEATFFGVPKVWVRVSGQEIEAPIAYRRARATTVLWRVDSKRAAECLEGVDLRPVRVVGGAALALTWFEYAETTIGPYNEFSVALVATPERRPSRLPIVGLLGQTSPIEAHVLHLPVTTEVARAGGVELFGYPKIVADIRLDYAPEGLSAMLGVGGVELLSMQIPLGGGLSVPMPDLVTYSALGGYLMRTHIRTHCRGRLLGGRRAQLELHAPEHPICRTLARLGLPARPAWVLHSDPFQSLLPLPQPLRPLPVRTHRAA